jgi:hypothetical protein
MPPRPRPHVNVPKTFEAATLARREGFEGESE